ncbi:molybdenum cofactor sulfurase [Streptomyces inusitatus]|uniref:Molybdenum cofactor sulfurase n=1 Tax=Streptomyces inusitatus TaxID=68221 RepID=A0A918UMG4_9ACTN|nr:MOSC N-terminal beta barrel domain-containing protein [Streptomyces inusitatus]GGZ20793.1 molybdenum cofactor sulfurase [Streptomyces inusitatus]
MPASDPAITVRELIYYPVKGCAGTEVDSASVGEMGLLHDRVFMAVDAEDGSFRSQRTLPALAAVRPEVLDGGARLRLSADGVESVVVEVEPDAERRAVTLFGRPVGEVPDQGDMAAEWFSEVLGKRSRLVRVPPGFDRDGWGETPGKVGFADAHALLIASRRSLDDLNARITAGGGRPVPMNRFRPNIVLDGCAEPHDEDRMRGLGIGTAEFAYSVRAMRCAVPMVDQVTGVRSGPEPIRTLATYRREPEYENKVSFGMKAAVLRHGVLSVGDAVRVTWAAEQPV